MTPALAIAALALISAQPDPQGPSPAPPSGAPPTIDSLLDQPPISEDARQAAVQGAYAAAQARRGGLDGRWRLEAADGRALYIFQLSDPGPVPDPRSGNPSIPVIEGAWRDPARKGSGGSGFLDSVQRDGSTLTLRFADGDRPLAVSLRQRASGDWAGAIDGAGPSRPVVMRRF
jgi:hypothetical protein